MIEQSRFDRRRIGHCGGNGRRGNKSYSGDRFQSPACAWLHSPCWPAWYAGRQAEAVAALATMGIAARFARRFRKKRGRIMGGLGSGRPSGSRREKVEACRSIDINRLHKTGCLRAGWAGGWQWMRDGERIAWINLRAEMDRVHLSYRWRVAGGEWKDVERRSALSAHPVVSAAAGLISSALAW